MTSLIPLSTGVSLEVKLAAPAAASVSGNKLAVLLHPYSWLGGQMNDPVLHALGDALLGAGYHVLRYNSRSVGRSTGWASFTGFSEAGDLAALVEWAVGYVQDVREVVVLGYSYGALIASLQPVLAGIRTVHVLVSYPLGVRGLLTLFRGRYQTAIESLEEVLVVCGDHDEFTGAAAYSRWMDSLPSAKCVLVKGGTHFWRGADGDSLVEIVLAWLQTQ